MAINIFPTISNNTTVLATTNKKTGNAKEYAWDFEKDDFILKNGIPVIVTENEAVKIWIYKALNTQRYRYFAYTNDYGQEYENLIGTRYSNSVIKSESERLTREALFVHPDIKEIVDFNADILDETLKLTFTVNTTYGQLKINFNY